MAKDSLARGARSANFGSMSHIKQDKWDSIFAPDETTATDPGAVSPQETNETPTPTPEKE